MPYRLMPVLAAFLWIAGVIPAAAQDGGKAFTAQVYAVDGQTLTAEGRTIGLWGVEAGYPRGTPESLRARAHLDDLIGTRPVRCLALSKQDETSIRARCLNGEERDLALMMVNAGLVAVSRREIAGSELAAAYMGAERQARANKTGLWGASGPAPAAQDDAGSGMPGGVPVWAIAGALLVVPLIGFLMMGLIMQMGFSRLINLQKYQIAGTQKRERQLKEREKYVIASALESELMTNRAKLDAFLTIYEELLKSLRDPGKTPKYQRAGDIIHEKPALARTVYDAHVDKLDLMGPQLSSEIATLYNLIVPNPDYRTLEPEVPIEKARDIIARIVRNAEKLIEPMDKVSGALAIIVRDKRGAVTTLE